MEETMQCVGSRRDAWAMFRIGCPAFRIPVPNFQILHNYLCRRRIKDIPNRWIGSRWRYSPASPHGILNHLLSFLPQDLPKVCLLHSSLQWGVSNLMFTWGKHSGINESGEDEDLCFRQYSDKRGQGGFPVLTRPCWHSIFSNCPAMELQ